uniref:Uncharacterized protein n=1 Tax=Zea mays TaxID=4577 RepID=B4FYC8_MAIZE|nr:unknown [Zea mays]
MPRPRPRWLLNGPLCHCCCERDVRQPTCVLLLWLICVQNPLKLGRSELSVRQRLYSYESRSCMSLSIVLCFKDKKKVTFVYDFLYTLSLSCIDSLRSQNCTMQS